LIILYLRPGHGYDQEPRSLKRKRLDLESVAVAASVSAQALAHPPPPPTSKAYTRLRGTTRPLTRTLPSEKYAALASSEAGPSNQSTPTPAANNYMAPLALRPLFAAVFASTIEAEYLARLQRGEGLSFYEVHNLFERCDHCGLHFCPSVLRTHIISCVGTASD